MSIPAFRASLAPGTTLTRVEGKQVLFSVRTGESFGLNEMAAEMLRRLFESDSQAAALALASEYSAPAEEIAHDLHELATELAGLRLVVLEK